jgi:hypothetical protein
VIVRVAFIDSTPSFNVEVFGEAYGVIFHGEPMFSDAMNEAETFINDTDAIHIGDNKYVPRHRVHRYIIGERQEHNVDITNPKHW